MKPTPKLLIHTALAAQPALRTPRFVHHTTVRAALPTVMGNRAFIRAWAARRAKTAARTAH
jgi:hypothetical protein